MNLKVLREQANLTQTELADKVGIKQSTVANYEAGTRFPRVPHLKTMAKVLGCSVDALLGGVTQ